MLFYNDYQGTLCNDLTEQNHTFAVLSFVQKGARIFFDYVHYMSEKIHKKFITLTASNREELGDCRAEVQGRIRALSFAVF